MGFFSSKPKPTASSLPPPQAPTMMYLQPYPQPYPLPDPLPYYNQQPPLHSFAQPAAPPYQPLQRRAWNDQSSSIEDYHAIEEPINKDTVIDQFNDIITSIDEDICNNDDDFQIVISEEPAPHDSLLETTRAITTSRNYKERRRTNQPKIQKITIWSKVSHYSNSRLPSDLPPLRVYIPTWPLICLAAQYSANAYKSPQGSQEKEVFVSADARLGTKAMVMKSVPCDDKKTLVFAIRGTSVLSLRDWNVNLHTAPDSPGGFLDDEGNLCHAGFLRVAKAMIRPIAMRLRTLLEENPSRASCSLLITGHSAGGAVAALLYSHMLSSVKSELSILTSCFKRVHCVTFGAPPVSLLPLSKPSGKKFDKSLFFSFINEGDPVVRAEVEYIRSLVNLLSSPLPMASSSAQSAPKTSFTLLQNSISKLDLNLSKVDLTSACNRIQCNPLKQKVSRFNLLQSPIAPPFPQTTRPAHRRHHSHRHHWSIPTATLSNAGRLVIMRVPSQATEPSRKRSDLQETTSVRWEKDNLSQVTAHTVTDEQLRRVVFGDPNVHKMEVYLRRVDMLALKAVTARY